MKNVEEFDKAIEKLDELILNGFSVTSLARNDFHKYNKAPKSSTTNHEELIKKHRRKYHKWHDDVYRSITEVTDRNYYLVRFANASGIGNIMIDGLTMGQSGFIVAVEARITALNEILAMLEERRSVVIRQEIAKQERDASTLYEATFIGRELKVNDIYLSKPDFMSENEQFFSYIFERPWQKIKIEDMLTDLRLAKFKKSVAQMLNDLKITGNVRKVFCPDASSKGIVFRNPISRGFADQHHLPTLDFGRNDKK